MRGVVKDLPKVSILIPCRNEQDYITQCLRSLDNQDYPNVELIIVDGMSTDNTIDEIANIHFERADIKAKAYFNPDKTMPHGVNIGISHAKGELIMICGAHSTYPADYVSKCVKVSRETGADNVGGRVVALIHDPFENRKFKAAICHALTSKFGTAKIRYNPFAQEYVDTVFGGCYRREVFDKIGMFNTDLTHTQDLEFNYRLRKAGGMIICDYNIESYWEPRQQKSWKAFAEKAFIDGQWVILPVLYCETPITLRHLVPLAFVLTLPLSIWPYMILNLINSQKFRPWYLLSIAFFTLHMFYGAGSVWGCFKVIKEWMKRVFKKSELQINYG